MSPFRSLLAIILLLQADILFGQMSGNYTVGPGGNYSSVNAAFSAVKSQGTAGNVHFLIKPGVYSGLLFSTFTPSNLFDTVFFESQTHMVQDVEFSGPSEVNYCTLVWFRNIRFETTDGQQASLFKLYKSTRCGFDSCIFNNSYQNCFSEDDALLNVRLPDPANSICYIYSSSLNSPNATIKRTGQGKCYLTNDTITGKILNLGYDFFTGTVFNITDGNLQFYYGQSFTGCTFLGTKTLNLVGNCYNCEFYPGINQLVATNFWSNHCHSNVESSHSDAISIKGNIFEANFQEIYDDGSKMVGNIFYDTCDINCSPAYFYNNFFFSHLICTTGTYYVEHNTFGPDGYLEMLMAGGPVNNNILSEVYLTYLVPMSNNDWYGNDMMSIYDDHPYFYDPQFASPGDLHSTNPALTGKSLKLGNITELKKDFDGSTRRNVPTIGANEVCFHFQQDTVTVKCDSLRLDLCSDTVSNYYWTPSWLFSDSTSMNPTIFPPAPVMIYLNEAGSGVKDSVFVNVEYWDVPVAAAIHSVNGLTVHFQSRSLCSESIHWSFGDGKYSNEPDVVHTYPFYGSFTCLLTVSNLYGTDTLSIPLLLTCLPDSVFLSCDHDSIILTSCINDFYSYYWTPSSLFPDSTQLNPVIFPVQDVTVKFHSMQNLQVVSVKVVVSKEKPVAALAYSISSNTVSFSDSSSCSDSVRWNFGDGNFSSLRNPVHTYDAGSYQGNLIAFNPNGRDTAAFSITILGVEERHGQNFKIYPNPAEVSFMIEPSGADPYSFVISDITGKEIFISGEKKGKESVDVSGLPGGIYLVKFENGVVVKLVVSGL